MIGVGPFPVFRVIERLRQRADCLLEVGSAADLKTALEQNPRVAIAAYVTSAELGRPIKYTGPTAIQNCDVTLRVVLFVRDYTHERTGAGARETMDTLIIPQVREALFGWTPEDAFNAISFQAGRDENYAAGWLVSQQVFGTDYRLSQQVQP